MALSRGDDDPRSQTPHAQEQVAGPAGRRRATHRPPGSGPRLWGSRPGRLGVFTVIAGAVIGALLTIISGSQPGRLLGAFVVAATAVAVFAVAPRAAYMVIPVPALAYVAAAIAAGLITGSAAGTSRSALAISAVQWVASGFLAMVAATALAIVAAAGRWLAARHGLGWPRRGQSPPVADPHGTLPGDGAQDSSADYPASGGLRAGQPPWH